MTLIEKTDLQAEARGRLLEQYKAKPNFEAFVTLLARQTQELEEIYFDILAAFALGTAVGEQLDFLGQIIGRERLGLSDTAYRVRLNAQVLLNKASGTLEEILAIIDIVKPGLSLVVREHFPAGFEIDNGTAITLAEGQELAIFIEEATGVGINGFFVFFEAPKFAFDTGGAGFDQGNKFAGTGAQ